MLLMTYCLCNGVSAVVWCARQFRLAIFWHGHTYAPGFYVPHISITLSQYPPFFSIFWIDEHLFGSSLLAM
ncbi:hypothetical protein BD289DRAFT_433390 [Coniella lustricola]|uniref:Uncharacterized protein n=1 Tax=Coniella lustricola TaxID=2025994 RepID=A0A2T3A8Q1_9PEZI|nr:hypothetical protein BD289DRAFT_433390 [Coniella lustricola]